MSQNLDENASDDSHDTTSLRYACPFGYFGFHVTATVGSTPPIVGTTPTRYRQSIQCCSYSTFGKAYATAIHEDASSRSLRMPCEAKNNLIVTSRVPRLACVILTDEPFVVSRHQLSPYELDWTEQ